MSRDDALVYVALGSNVGNRAAHLALAVREMGALEGLVLSASSRVYETDPIGPGPQGCYLNAVVRGSTLLPPRVLLDALHAIERRAGRERSREERFSARTLDLDLLFYGDLRIDAPDLVVPHPRLHERSFVLEPLCELAPDMPHPILGLRLSELAARVRDPAAVRASHYAIALPGDGQQKVE